MGACLVGLKYNLCGSACWNWLQLQQWLARHSAWWGGSQWRYVWLFPGSFSSKQMMFWGPFVIWYLLFHSKDVLVHQIDSAVSTWRFPTVVSSHLCMLVAPNGRHFSKHTPNLQRITFLWQESHMQDIMCLLLLGAYIELWKRRRVYLST